MDLPGHEEGTEKTENCHSQVGQASEARQWQESKAFHFAD